MNHSEMRDQICKHHNLSGTETDAAIKYVLEAFGCIIVPPHHPNCPVGRFAIVQELSKKFRVSEVAAGDILARVISEITFIGRENGIHSVLEFRRE